MLRTSPLLLALVCLLGAGVLVSARKNVTVAYVDEYSWIPHRIAEEQGYFDAVSLNVTLKGYPNRTALLAGAANAEWDFATADMFANILGGHANITGVGLAMDISNTINMVGNSYAVENLFPPQPNSFPVICVTKGTLSDYVAQKCMETFGFAPNGAGDAIELMYENQTHCQNEITPGFFPVPYVDIAGLDSPLHYQFLQANPGSQVLCSGLNASAPVTVGHMVRNEFAKTHPNAVTKLLAVWFRTLAFMNIQHNKANVSQLVMDSYSSFNAPLRQDTTAAATAAGTADAAKTNDLSPFLATYGLQDFQSTKYLHFEAQLNLMNRRPPLQQGDATLDVIPPADAADMYETTAAMIAQYLPPLSLPPETSTYDFWMDEVARFMADSDLLPANHLNASAFMDGRYVDRLNGMPHLKKWALGDGLEGIDTLDLATLTSNATAAAAAANNNNMIVAKGQDLP